MHPLRIAIIIFITLLSISILWNLWSSAKPLTQPLAKSSAQPLAKPLTQPLTTLSLIEGFGEPTNPDSESKGLRAKYDSLPLSIKGGIPEKYLNLPIREFIVKSSYNSAISGLFASKDALKLSLERGCRFIDLEVYSRNDVEYISYSGDPEYRTMGTENNSANRLKLTDALNTTAGSAFSSPIPSTNDPLFILLRIKDNSAPIYKRIAKHINTAFSQRLFTGTLNSGTHLRKLQGKVVIFLDVLSAPKWNEYDKCDNPNECLDAVVHLEAGTTNFPLYAYGDLLSLPPLIVNRNTNNLKTNINSFMIVEPPQFDAIKPPNPDEAIDKWHPQFLAYKLYQPGDELANYEDIFNKYGCAFVPMSVYIADSNMKNANHIQTPK